MEITPAGGLDFPRVCEWVGVCVGVWVSGCRCVGVHTKECERGCGFVLLHTNECSCACVTQ